MALTIWKGNRLPVLTDTIQVSGSPFNLTGGTVLFSMRPQFTATPKINQAAASITNASSGAVSYAWTSSDVDATGTFYAWWTYSILGKTQDTPEFQIQITEHTPGTISVPRPVAADGSTSIYKGMAYLNAYGNPLVYNFATYDAPNFLSVSSITLRVEGEFHVVGTAIDDDTVSFDLSSSLTNVTAGSYRFQVETVLTTGATALLLRSNFVVNDSISSP